jgi:protein-S-isoprenylcysteine O-methyltransferase Ste14
LLVVVAGVVLVFSRTNAASAELSTFDAISIAIIVLLTVLSTFSNILKTNFLFGIILTLIQLLFSGLLIVVAAAVWGSARKRGQGQ